MAENKTRATTLSVADYLAGVDDTRRADAETLTAMMAEATGEPATMWGPSIIGFGVNHYKYDSGREGDICLVGFSPRAAALTLYANVDFPDRKSVV